MTRASLLYMCRAMRDAEIPRPSRRRVIEVGWAKGLSICSECGAVYRPTRKPAVGRRNFCPECGVRAARRIATREYHARKRAMKKTEVGR